MIFGLVLTNLLLWTISQNPLSLLTSGARTASQTHHEARFLLAIVDFSYCRPSFSDCACKPRDVRREPRRSAGSFPGQGVSPVFETMGGIVSYDLQDRQESR